MKQDYMYYRPDMGWEPVWYGLWIKMAELIKENLPKENLKVLLSLDYPKFQKQFSHDKNETEPVWLSPIFAIFQAPPCKVLCINNTYNQTQVRPDYNK